MKKLFAILALVAGSAHSATLVPVQLLNPAGSTSGQAIISTGASGQPVWGNVTAAALAAQAANTVLANVTASSASPTAVAIPSCSAANSAIQYTSATGFTCSAAFALTSGTLAQFAATTSAQLAGVLSDETGTGSAVFANAPTINQPNIVASTTGTAASAGSVGYYQTANLAAASATSGTPQNVASASLAPGVWDVQCTAQFISAGTTVQQVAQIGVSTTSATFGAYPTTTTSAGTTTAGFQQVFSSPRVPLSLTTTTTVYCVAQSNFSVSTLQIAGTIGAWLRH